MAASALDAAAAALRDFVHRSGALRAQALIELAAGEPPAIVSCVRLGPLEIVAHGRTVHLDHDAALAPSPVDLGDLRPLPPFDVDAQLAEIAGVVGGLDLIADAVRRVASALGPHAAVVVELPTTSPAVDLAVSARAGEPVLVTLGEDSYEL